jgi:two-component system sensor histidine kinase KdpD
VILHPLSQAAVAERMDVEARRTPVILHPLSQAAVAERILALVTPEPRSQRILRRAFRSAQRLGAEVDALWVRKPNRQPSDAEAASLAALRRLASILGAHFLEVEGERLVEAIREVARERGSTYVFVGTPDESRLTEIRRGSLVSALVRELPGVDIRVVADRVLRDEEHP